MKKVINLTESELINLIGRIVEDVDTSFYREEDFMDAFIQVFKPWVIKNHGDELLNHPPSYLFKKYSEEFMEHIGYTGHERNWRNSATDIGRYILKKELHSYKNLKQTTKFTEKFKAPMDALIKGLHLPDYLSLEIGEYEPYEVYAKMIVDFPKLIKSGVNPNEVPRPTEYLEKLKKNVTSFLGPKLGSANFGELDFVITVPDTNNSVDDWVKNVLNKEIKKKIKELPQAKEFLHSVKFEPNLRTLHGEITLIFKQARYGRNFNRGEFIAEVRKLLSDMGYNENVLEVYTK